MPTKKPLSFECVHQFLKTLFAQDLHAKRVLSLAGATLGVIESASLAVGIIGQGLALVRGRLTKARCQAGGPVAVQPGGRRRRPAASLGALRGGEPGQHHGRDGLDQLRCRWQTTIMRSLLCGHGRATPLVWLTVETAMLKARRNDYEYQVLARLAEALPANVRVRIVADRGFGDQKLYRVLTEELKFDFVIRFRGNILVTAADGEARAAADWVGTGGRARVLRGATVTAAGYEVGAVVCLQAKDIKEPSRALRVLPPEDRFAMVPGRQRCGRASPGPDRPLRQTLGDRVRLSRHQGPALRHGHERDAHQHA